MYQNNVVWGLGFTSLFFFFFFFLFSFHFAPLIMLCHVAQHTLNLSALIYQPRTFCNVSNSSSQPLSLSLLAADTLSQRERGSDPT
jgi:hypothetical protein